MYQAWADFVKETINGSIKGRLKTQAAYYECVKIPPTGRVKTVDSLVAKAFIRKRGRYRDPYREITDKAGIRFVVLLTEQLDLLSNIVESSDAWSYSKDKEFDEWKDDDPRMFDYQSVHYIVKAANDFQYQGVDVKAGTPCEVQLRTLLQHAYAELAHDTIYKGNIKASPEVHRCFAKSMALMETTDDLLCNAKRALEEASIDVKRWLEAVNEESEVRLSDCEMLYENKNSELFIDALRELLARTSVEAFQTFLDEPENLFIAERIKGHIGAEAGIEFKSPFILLVYFLSYRFTIAIKNHWPFDFVLLQRVFNDLGLAPNWAET